jgi:hypothetical protein
MTPDPAAQASPVPWPMILVLATGAFSAMAWGLSTLFAPRARAPASDEAGGSPEGGADRGGGGGSGG